MSAEEIAQLEQLVRQSQMNAARAQVALDTLVHTIDLTVTLIDQAKERNKNA